MRNVLEKLKSMFTKNKKPILHSLIFIGYIVTLVFTFVLIINLNIVSKTNDNIVSIEEINKLSNDFDCIIILGAGVKSNGTPTDMLRDRLLTGHEAYKHLDSPILVSGDSENLDYTETTTMKQFLIDKGISEDNIISDGYGLSTYESIWRAKNVYGYNKILIISQKYHLHRAIYIAQKLGITAYGVDGALTSYGKQPIYSFREYLARIKDMLYSEIKPLPKYAEVWREVNE